MNTLAVALDDIDVGNRLRGIDPAYVQMLAESISHHGQMTPIEVRKLPPGAETPYVLVAGAHRIEALRALGKPTVTATVFDGNELSARLREIEENLARHDLTELDRAAFFAEKKAIYEALHPETKHGGDRKDKFVPLMTSSFAQETARRLGYDERSIKRFVLRHQRLTPGVRRSLTAPGSPITVSSSINSVNYSRTSRRPSFRCFSATAPTALRGSPTH